MKGGDLDNAVVPRIILVFEGALGFLPDSAVKDYEKAVKKQRWDDAIALWEFDEHMMRKIWDLTYRKSVTVEIVTFISQPFADVLAARLDEEDMPIRRVWYSTPARLSRQLAHMIDVSTVYDPDETHMFTYGAKGRVINDPNQLGE